MLRATWVLILASLALAGCLARRGELKPLNPAAGAAAVIVGQPQLVTFSELEADPERYRDTLLRISGVFYHLPPLECFPANGARAEWALVDSGLRLDAVGLESLVHLSAEGIDFTVDGIFRLYEGPVGCGKEPPAATSWYLQALQIIQPNPLIRSERPPGYEVVIVVPTIPAPIPIPYVTPAPGVTRTPVLPPTVAAQPTIPGAATIAAGTPTVTASPTRVTTPAGSPTAAGTPSPGPSPTPEPTNGASPTPTTGGGGYPPPGTPPPASTPPGYP
jgi:hypothetical protein